MLTPTKPVKSCECGGSCGGCCCCTKESIGLGNVDNTSDLNKPLSTDMVNALSGKVDLDVFTQLKNRVLALENSIPDITSLENRITNAEANIVTLQSNYANLSQAISNLTATVNTLSGRVTGVNDALVTVGTRVDALEAKDSNNVKLSGASEQTIQGTLKANDPASGATDKTLVTANWVSQTGGASPNNLIHKTGDETKKGKLTLEEPLILYKDGGYAPTIVSKKNFDSTTPPTAFEFIGGGFTIKDVNNRVVWNFTAYRDTNGLDVMEIRGFASDDTYGYFHFEVGPNNYHKIVTNFNKPSNW